MNIEMYKKDRESNKGKTMTSIAMSENGRILIPAAIREQLGFKPNSKIFAEMKDGSLILTSAAQRSAQRRAYFDNLMKELNIDPNISLVDELIAERRAEAVKE
jgi:AbrB family looped-hinge helix DNA binding protein